MEAFLTMFTTELQYQDPTNPLESYELAAQLAQFSTVSVLTELNDNIEAQESYLSSINNALMVDLIGKEVTASSSTVQVADGKAQEAAYTLGDAASSVTVNIYDADGALIRRMDMGELESGAHSLSWDGLDDSGNAVEDGQYTIEVEATDKDGNTVDASTTITDKVYSVQLNDSTTYLILGGSDGVPVPISAIADVHEASTTADTEES
jgi:flagellar basal-body rod modification protein FlgD